MTMFEWLVVIVLVLIFAQLCWIGRLIVERT